MSQKPVSSSILFQFLPQRDKEVERVLKPISKIQRIPAKEIINVPGDDVNGLYYIYSGKTRHYIVNNDGIEKVLYYLTDGWLFGEAPSQVNRATTIFSATEADTEIWRFTYEQSERLMQECLPYAHLLLRCVAYKQIYLRFEVENLCFNPCKERLKRALCTEVDSTKLIDGAWYELKNQYSHYELSVLIGSVRVTVSKQLSELCEENFIRILNRKVQVNAKEFDAYISEMKIL